MRGPRAARPSSAASRHLLPAGEGSEDLAQMSLMPFLAAAVFIAALSLIGFAAMPSAWRPQRARQVLPASLSFGALLFGWCAFLPGTFISTWTIVPLLAIATLA